MNIEFNFGYGKLFVVANTILKQLNIIEHPSSEYVSGTPISYRVHNSIEIDKTNTDKVYSIEFTTSEVHKFKSALVSLSVNINNPSYNKTIYHRDYTFNFTKATENTVVLFISQIDKLINHNLVMAAL